MTNGPPPVRETTRTTRGKALGIAWHAHGSGATSRQGESRGRFRRQRPSRHRCGRKGHARCQAGPFDPQVGISDCFPTLKSLLQSALRASSAARRRNPPCIARTPVVLMSVSAVAPVQLFRLLCVVCLRRQYAQLASEPRAEPVCQRTAIRPPRRHKANENARGEHHADVDPFK